MTTRTIIKEIRLKNMLCPVCSGELTIPAEVMHSRCDYCTKLAHDACMNIVGESVVMDQPLTLWQCSNCFSSGLSE